MTSFRTKTVGPSDVVGAIFRRKREDLFLAVETVSRKTGIARQYLAALEEGRYTEIPGLVYGKSFVRVYAGLLGLAKAPLVRAFTEEYTLATATATQSQHTLRMAAPRVLVTPGRVRFVLACCVFAVLGLYFGNEVVSLVRPARLVVAEPQDNMIVRAREIVVRGEVEDEASVTVNDAYIAHDAGIFYATIPLQEGVNTLTIRAARRHGRAAEVVRKVFREEGETVAQR